MFNITKSFQPWCFPSPCMRHQAGSWLVILAWQGTPEGQTKYIWPKKWRKLAHRQIVPTLGNSKYQLFHVCVPGLLFSIYSNIASQARPLASCWRVWYVLSINVAQNYSNLTVTADEQWTFPIACQQNTRLSCLHTNCFK